MEKHEKQIPICPLCLRIIPPDVPQSLHHLIPKLKGGKKGPTILLSASLSANQNHVSSIKKLLS